MLAIVKTIERFHIYLYGLEFTVVTDCNAVVHAINKACLNPRIAKWILTLQDYKFKVKHRDGRHMAHVDALSRVVCFTDSIPLEKELQFRQLQNTKLKAIAENLELNEHDKYELIDGLVFRKGLHKHRFVVPDSMITNIIRIYHDDMKKVAVAAPWANGLVERINRFLKSSLKKLVDDHQYWNIHLDTIQYVMNNTYHSALKASPSKILLRIEQRNNADIELIDFLNKIAGAELDSDKDRLSSLELAVKATNKIKQYNKIYYKHKKPSIYKEGDLVLIRDSTLKPGDDKKLKSNYKGPYQVAKVLDKNRFVIKDKSRFN
ncbi:retrovirus-like pol polyprotein, partial [Lasius niger]